MRETKYQRVIDGEHPARPATYELDVRDPNIRKARFNDLLVEGYVYGHGGVDVCWPTLRLPHRDNILLSAFHCPALRAAVTPCQGVLRSRLCDSHAGSRFVHVG